MKDPKRLASLAVSVTMGFALIGLAVQQSAYSWLLFLGVPFLTGFVAIMIYAWGERRRLGRCIGVSMIPLPVICGLVVAWKIDGLICCLMAAPIALPLAILGGYLAWLMQSHKTAVIGSCLILLVPPGIIF